MSSKKKKKRAVNNYQENYYDEILKEKVPFTVYELIKMIHRVNPTGEEISPQEACERYKIKTRLQSLLIRRFNESLIVEQPEPDNPRLVGFRLRHFNEDACHAMIDELDEDARAWTQRQIDEDLTNHSFASTEILKKSIHYESMGSADYSPSDRVKEKEENLTKDELIKLGQNALAEYDYEACEYYYHLALKVAGNDSAPMLFLLELYVDYLAAYEKALDLSNTIAVSIKTNDKVKVLLALAAARSGHIDTALEWIKRITHPRASEVYVLSIRRFLQEGDLERASNCLSELESFGQAELKPEIDQFVKGIQALRAKSLEPIEQEMLLSWQEGRTEDSLKLADRILSVSPENKAAGRIRYEFEKQQLEEKVNQLLRLADEANQNKDFSREAELLNKAIAIGAKDQNLAKRLASAQNEARLQKEEMEIYSLINLLAEGNLKKAFLQYINLNTQQRSRLKDKIYDPHLAWLDQILSAPIITKSEKVVEAVLILSKNKEALKQGREPERIMAEMEPHLKVLQPVPEAQKLWRQAEMTLQTMKYKEAKDLLDKAIRFLDLEDSQKARACLDQIKVDLWREDDQRLFNDLNHRLPYLEKFMRQKQMYTEAHERGDHLTARKMAEKLAEHTGENKAGYWLDRAQEHSSHLKKEWSLTSIDLDELPMYYASFGLRWLADDTKTCLRPEARQLIIASSQERWVFLRIFSLDDQKLKKVIILRAPKQMLLQNIGLEGKVLWITSGDGAVLAFDLEQLNILYWYDFSSFATEEEVIEGVFLFPKSKFLWLDKRYIKTNFETIEIIDIERQRIVHQVKASCYPMIINMGGHFRAAIQNLTTNTVQVYSERGNSLENFAFEKSQTIHVATLHPNGNDYVFFPFDDQGSMNLFQESSQEPPGDLVMNLLVRPAPKGKYQPLRIENSNGELQHLAFTSLETGLVFFIYRDAFSEGSNYLLSAFRETGQGFELVYEVNIPCKIVFACDEFSRQVAAINFQGNQVQFVVLNENPPVFDFTDNNFYKKDFPDFRADYYICNNPTGEIKDMSLAYAMQLKNFTKKEFDETVNRIKQPGFNNPDEIVAFIHALHSTFNFTKANEIKMWMRTQYPNHFSVLQDLAEEAAREKRWPEAVSLLEKISRSDLNHGNSCHICHLLGIGYFFKGQVQKALDIWREGEAYEDGECDLDPYLEYAEIALTLPEKRPKEKNDLINILDTFESIDHHLNNMRWGEAVAIIENTPTLVKTDLQMLGRLTWAFLNQNVKHGERQWLYKIIILGNYCQVFNNKFRCDDLILPPYIETWSESRLSEIAKQAKEWLDDL